MKITFKKPKISKPRFEFKLKDLALDKDFFRKIIILTKKELQTYFVSPIAYIVLCIFLVIVSVIFFGIYQFLQFGTNDLAQMFSAIAFAFVIIVPALTMGSISREKQSGTIEFILTQPISEFQFLLSKFLSNTFILLVGLILTLPITIILSTITQLDSGQLIMQYLGALLLGASFISIGISVSSFFKSEIISLIVSVIISTLFVVIGTSLFNVFPIQIQGIIEKLSLLTHYHSMSRGVLDIRDLLFFVGFILAFLSASYYFILKLKLPAKHKELNNSRIFLVLSITIAIMIGTIGQLIPGRIDFTSSQKYTLSQETLELLSSIRNPINIKYYSSGNLPLELQSVSRNVADILNDYVVASKGALQFTQYDPSNNEELKLDAQQRGIHELVFAVNSTDSSQQVVGFLGISLESGDRSESINLSSDVASDLEYQISLRIKKLITENKINIGMLSNNVQHGRFSTYRIFSSLLTDLYDVVDLTLTDENLNIPSDIKTIIIPGPIEEFSEKVMDKLKSFFKEGGSIILFSDTLVIPGESVTPTINKASLGDLFSDYGVTLDDNFVYDRSQNQLIGISDSSGAQFPVNYPMWFIANSTHEAEEVIKNVSNITILWGGSITVDENKARESNLKVYRLFETSENSNFRSGDNMDISIQSRFEESDTDNRQLVGVAIENSSGGRAIMVADSDFIEDNLISELMNRQQGFHSLNLAFALGSVEWGARDNQLSSIKAKSSLPVAIALTSDQKLALIVLGIGAPILMLSTVGGIIIYRRKRISNKSYEV